MRQIGIHKGERERKRRGRVRAVYCSSIRASAWLNNEESVLAPHYRPDGALTTFRITGM